MAKLDTTTPYGAIYGEHRAAYEQDGKLFNGSGEELEAEEPTAEAPPPAEVRVPKSRKRPVTDNK
jgi:hypothetical protein